jgi:hypothetical protein
LIIGKTHTHKRPTFHCEGTYQKLFFIKVLLYFHIEYSGLGSQLESHGFYWVSFNFFTVDQVKLWWPNYQFEGCPSCVGMQLIEM